MKPGRLEKAMVEGCADDLGLPGLNNNGCNMLHVLLVLLGLTRLSNRDGSRLFLRRSRRPGDEDLHLDLTDRWLSRLSRLR